jgi:hypothetical protein
MIILRRKDKKEYSFALDLIANCKPNSYIAIDHLLIKRLFNSNVCLTLCPLC